jgi:hypothetical protein
VVVWKHLGQHGDDEEDEGEPDNHVANGVQHLDPVCVWGG